MNESTLPPFCVTASTRWRDVVPSTRNPGPVNCGCARPWMAFPGRPASTMRAMTAWPTNRLVRGSSSVSGSRGGTDAGTVAATSRRADGTVTGWPLIRTTNSGTTNVPGRAACARVLKAVYGSKLTPLTLSIWPWAPGRSSSPGGPAIVAGHSTESSSVLNVTRRNDGSPGRTTGGSNSAVAVVSAGISSRGCESMSDIRGSRDGAALVWAASGAAAASNPPASRESIFRPRSPPPPGSRTWRLSFMPGGKSRRAVMAGPGSGHHAGRERSRGSLVDSCPIGRRRSVSSL